MKDRFETHLLDDSVFEFEFEFELELELGSESAAILNGWDVCRRI